MNERNLCDVSVLLIYVSTQQSESYKESFVHLQQNGLSLWGEVLSPPSAFQTHCAVYPPCTRGALKYINISTNISISSLRVSSKWNLLDQRNFTPVQSTAHLRKSRLSRREGYSILYSCMYGLCRIGAG